MNLNKKKSVQLMSIYSLCYYGFLRINECLNIRKKEIIKDEEGRIVFMIPVSKTDQTEEEFKYLFQMQTQFTHLSDG